MRKCIFLGYVYKVKGYWLWCVDTKLPKFISSQNINFDKSQGKGVYWC